MPDLPDYGGFTAAEHAAHTTRRGIHRPEDLVPGSVSTKFTKQLMKAVRKPHLMFKKATRGLPKRKKKLKA